MKAMVDEDIWFQLSDAAAEIFDWSTVTAFKVKDNGEIKLDAGEPFEVLVRAKVPEKMDEKSMDRLSGKTYDENSGAMMAYLQATNNFGFTTKKAPEPKESNSVWVRVPFAGFTVKKVDSDNGDPLAGAMFTLTGLNTVQTAKSDETGILQFRGLTEGTYTLTETVAPTGYSGKGLSLRVTITQDPNTMVYTVTFEDTADSSVVFEGEGTDSKPLIIKNERGFTLPKTGGSGTLRYTLGGLCLLAAAACLLLHKKFSRRNRDCQSL